MKYVCYSCHNCLPCALYMHLTQTKTRLDGTVRSPITPNQPVSSTNEPVFEQLKCSLTLLTESCKGTFSDAIFPNDDLRFRRAGIFPCLGNAGEGNRC